MRALAHRVGARLHLIVRVLLVVLAVVVAANVWQVIRERDQRIEQNRDLTCAIGSFLLDARQVRVEEGTLTPAREAAYARILAAVADDDCPEV